MSSEVSPSIMKTSSSVCRTACSVGEPKEDRRLILLLALAAYILGESFSDERWTGIIGAGISWTASLSTRSAKLGGHNTGTAYQCSCLVIAASTIRFDLITGDFSRCSRRTNSHKAFTKFGVRSSNMLAKRNCSKFVVIKSWARLTKAVEFR